jgi:hypothetical protein
MDKRKHKPDWLAPEVEILHRPGSDETYIGDGCYASFDGYQIRLRTLREHGDDLVFLEPGTFTELLRFARLHWRV